MFKKIDHIGIAVKDLEETMKKFKDVYGLELHKVREVKDQKVKIAVFKIGETKIELLEPTEEESAVGRFIRKRGEGFHHIAFQVEDLGSTLEKIEGAGIKTVTDKPTLGYENHKIIFLHPKTTNGVLIELVEK